MDSLLEFAAGSGVGAVLTLLILRYALPHLFSRNLERFKAEMARAVVEHETRYAWLHERPARALVELSGLLADAEEVLGLAANMAALSEARLRQGSQELGSAIIALEDHLRKNRVFFDDEVRGLSEDLRNALAEVAWAGMDGAFSNAGERGEYMRRATTILRQHVIPLSAKIDARIRLLLAGEAS